MKPRMMRNMLLVTVVHLVVILTIVVSHWIRSRLRREPREVVTFVDLAMMVEPSSIKTHVASEPLVSTPSTPEPVAVKPKPVIPIQKPKKKKIERSKKRVRRNKVTPEPVPVRHKTSVEEIRNLLSPALSSSNVEKTNDFPYDWYYALVRHACYEAWNRPARASVQPGTVAVVSIRVFRDGTVREHQIIRASGNATMDASVLRALRTITRLKPLPTSYVGEFKDITIDFEFGGNG